MSHLWAELNSYSLDCLFIAQADNPTVKRWCNVKVIVPWEIEKMDCLFHVNMDLA